MVIKRVLSTLLALLICLQLCACAKEGQEIARSDYEINKNNVLADGFSSLKDRVNNVYEDPEDIVELGGNVAKPLVEFDDAVCLSIDGVDFYTRYLYYIMVEVKSSDISNALLYGINAKNEDAFWNSYGVDTYKTRRQVVEERALKACYNAAISNAIMGQYGFTESDSYILSYENIFSFYGNEQALDEYYGAYGLNNGYLKPYLRQYAAYSEFREFLVGTGGKLYPTEEQAKEYFKEKCLHFEQIVINYTNTDENGYTNKKTEAEIEEARSRGEELYKTIQNDSRMFDRNMHLTEHAEWSENVHGYTYVPNEIMPELEKAYFALQPGEITAVDTPLGYYIIRAREKTDMVYDANNSRIIDAYCEEKFTAVMDQYKDKLAVNESELARYAFDKVLVFAK